MQTMSIHARHWCAAALLAAMTALASPARADVDPPTRVARIGFLSGQVSFQPAGDNQWVEVSLNRPLVTGDKLYTDRDSRVELQIGAATVRMDSRSSFDLLNLDDAFAQMELTGGVMNLRVRNVGPGQSYEVDTPTLAFVVNQPGEYRIDIDPNGNSTMITVFDGAGDVYGQDNASYSVSAGNSYRFNDSTLRDYAVLGLPSPDDFDRWVDSRDARYTNSVSSRYVSEDVIGYADLDDYGAWSTAPSYGNIWYPASVSVGWAPYRSGHWAWIDPWGWTWVDNYAWGFAPFHYGRWAYVGNRWGWCPGPRQLPALYAPALVGFVGGGGWGGSISIGTGPVGWFPLGPRDVYVPWYRASRGYFTNINVRNTTVINNINITNVYNNYSRGRPINNGNYAYRTNLNAVTAVRRDAFVGARPVATSRVNIDSAQLRQAQVMSRVDIEPTRASFASGAARRGGAVPSTAILDRRVIARTAPPPRPISTEARLQAIQRNKAQPLPRAELNSLSQRHAATQTASTDANARARIQVVDQGNHKPQPLPMRSSQAVRGEPVNGNSRAPTARSEPPLRSTQPESSRTPVQHGSAENAQPANARTQPARGELQSTHFAPHGGNRTAPPPTGSQRTNAGVERGTVTPSQPRDSTARTVTPPHSSTDRGTEVRSSRTPASTAPASSRYAPHEATPHSAPRQQDPQPTRETYRAPAQREIQQPRTTPQSQAAPQEIHSRQAAPPRQATQPYQAPQQQVVQPSRTQGAAPSPPPAQRAQPKSREHKNGKDDNDQDKDRRSH